MILTRFLTPFFCLMLLLTACQEGAVIFEPTPLPPDLSPLQYQHPSGAFSVRIPRDWALYEQNVPGLVGVSFTPPGASAPAITIGVIKLNTPIEILSLINQYQTTIRPDAGNYDEQDRQAMGDGSWRLVGVRRPPGGGVQDVNTFFQRDEDTVAVMEIRLSGDATRLNQLEVAANTLIVNNQNTLTPTGINDLAFISPADVRVMNINAWSTLQNVYYVTGEIANFSPQALTNILVNVSLLDDEGAEMVGAADRTMGYVLQPGGYMPFSLRFGAGKPPEANRFSVNIGTGEALNRPVDDTSITWFDNSTITAEGHLLITGTATNNGTQTLYDPLAVVTVFDNAGRVVAAGFTPIVEGAFPAGDNADFSLRIQELGGSPTNYIVSLQAYTSAR